ncbi:hypothetical protein AKO1_008228 [Acrasis kona]|uniref:Uncharacterized protein n=1 Tax=Acrasis kona TaxID=1008807 RepID=A0AAW2YPJ6_9EUKA
MLDEKKYGEPVHALVPIMSFIRRSFHKECADIEDIMAFSNYFHQKPITLWSHFIFTIPFTLGILLSLEGLVGLVFNYSWLVHLGLVWWIFCTMFVLSVDVRSTWVLSIQMLVTYILSLYITSKYPIGTASLVLCSFAILFFDGIVLLGLGHYATEKSTPAFSPFEAVLITPYYVSLRTVYMDLFGYKPEWKKEILKRSTSERWEKYVRARFD